MPTPRSVRFSRTLGIADAIAMAAPIALAVGLFGVAPQVLSLAGSRAGWVYAVAAVLLLPIWIALTERSSAAVDSGSPYRVTGLGTAWAQFAVGSLSLLGYLSVSIVVLDLAIRNLSIHLEASLGVSIQPYWFMALMLLVIGLRVLTGGTNWTRTRAVLSWGALLVPIVAVAVGILERGGDLRELPEVEPLRYWLTSVALMGSSLWAIEPLLARRAELRRPGRTILAASIVVWLGLGVIAATATDLVMRDPNIDLETWLTESVRGAGQIELLLLTALVFLCVVALVRAAVAATRLTDSMATDGFLPAWLAPSEDGAASLAGVTLFLTATAAATLFGLDRLTTLGIAALAFFLIAVLALLPWARTPAADLPRRRYPHLPLHPLVPSAATAISLFLALLLPASSLILGGLWLALTAAVWFVYSRSHALRSPESGLLLGGDETEADRTGYRVLVAALEGVELDSLLRVAVLLARRHDGEVAVVQVVERSARAFPSQLHRHAESLHRDLEHRTEGLYPEDRVQALVRIAPSETAGIVAAANELDARLLLLPWLGDPENPINQREEELLERVFRATRRPIGVLRGELATDPSAICVGTAGGPHAPVALEIARDLSSDDHPVELLTVVSSALPPERGGEILERTLEASKVEDGTELRSVAATKTEKGILDATSDHDLLVLGSAVDRLLGRSFLGGVSAVVALARRSATLLIKREEPRASFLLRRLWQFVSGPLPQLTLSERSEVFLAMRSAARADVDFYVLISLSSALATFGLRQNSTAVVIGAMLVAPLMSPILALAHGLIQGHLQMIRRAAVSTTQGVATSVAVSAVIGILLPDTPPTQEMLSRGAPTLLDLAVAVTAGAAAAYGVSRKSVAASLPGVAIAVALVPPLCVAGHGLGDSEFTLAAGAFLLFLTNLTGIVLVGALVFLLLGFRPSTASRDERVRRGLLLSALAILLLAIPLGFQGRSLYQVQTLEAILEAELAAGGADARAENLVVRKVSGVLLITGEIFHYGTVERQTVIATQEELARRIGAPIELDLTLVPAQHLELEALHPRPDAQPEDPETER